MSSLNINSFRWFGFQHALDGNSFHGFSVLGACLIFIHWEQAAKKKILRIISIGFCFQATAPLPLTGGSRESCVSLQLQNFLLSFYVQHRMQHFHCTIMINTVGHFIHQHSMHNQDYHSSFQLSLTRGRPDLLPVLCIKSAHYTQWNLSPALCTIPQPAKSKKNYFIAFLLLYLFLHF